MGFVPCMNDISFTSRIKFVSGNKFQELARGQYVDFRNEQILNHIDMARKEKLKKIYGQGIKNLRLDVLKADEFYTDSVRTCTAGGVVNTKTGEAAGFHIYDSFDNYDETDDILENIFGRVKNPDRALLIGSKKLDVAQYSTEIFKQIKEGIMKRVPKVTLFREHTFPYSESNLCYLSEPDTWIINSMYRPLTDYKEYDVLTKQDLDKCFKEVKIADGDVLLFEKK